MLFIQNIEIIKTFQIERKPAGHVPVKGRFLAEDDGWGLDWYKRAFTKSGGKRPYLFEFFFQMINSSLD